MPWSQKFRSEALDMLYSHHTDGRVVTEDKTMYTRNECQIISDTIGEIDPVIHSVKSIFEGEIIQSDNISMMNKKYK